MARSARRPWYSGVLSLIAVPPVALLIFLGLRPDLVVVEHVEFEGNQRAQHDALRHLADITNGTTIWETNLEHAARSVQGHDWVRSADARFEWPDTVRVQVVEYEPVALLARQHMRYVSADGVDFAIADTDDLNYPVITGIDEELARLHPEIPQRIVASALELMTTVSDAGVIAREDIGEVSFSQARGFTIFVNQGAEVVFDLQHFDLQTRRLARLQDRGVDVHSQVFIDLAPASVAIVRDLEVRGGEG
jgi:cell division septal protein FtsQ